MSPTFAQVDKEHIRINRTVAGSYMVMDLADRRYAYTVGINDSRAERLYPWWSRLERYDDVVHFWGDHGILYEEAKAGKSTT